MSGEKILATTIFLLCNNGQVLADVISSQPTVGVNNTNGVPVVNINTPNADGVSHNVYSQFNVNQQGVILNNATSASQSALAGAIAGNSNITGNAAKLILNEINSSDKSVLKGMVEVAGSRADVVIANKAGITCDGCGFINTGHGTLTTSELLLKDGQLSGYRVNGGEIVVEGKGLLKGDVDYTAIISRTAKINAAIHASDLTIAAGNNEYDAQAKVTKALAAETSPDVLIDVSELGGMYAGKISLVANESGVGVNEQSTTTGLTITGNNNVGNGNGVIIGDNNVGTGSINIGSNVNINNANSSSGQTSNASTVGIRNKGTIQSTGALTINSATIENAGNISAGEEGVQLSGATLVNSGKIQSSGKIVYDGAKFTNTNSIISDNAGIEVSASSMNNSGVMQALKAINFNGASLENSGDIISSHDGISVAAASFNNLKNITASGDIEVESQSFTNSGNIISENGGLIASGASFNNSGDIKTAGTISHSGQSFNNYGNITSTDSTVVASEKSFNNFGKMIVAKAIDISAMSVNKGLVEIKQAAAEAPVIVPEENNAADNSAVAQDEVAEPAVQPDAGEDHVTVPAVEPVVPAQSQASDSADAQQAAETAAESAVKPDEVKPAEDKPKSPLDNLNNLFISITKQITESLSTLFKSIAAIRFW